MNSCNDDSFGPFVGQNCRGGFDFTLFFEQTIMSIPLSVILLTVSPIRLLHLFRQDAKAIPGKAHHFSLFLFLTYIGLQLASLVLSVSETSPHTRASIADTSLRVVDALVITTMSIFECRRSVRPSTILAAYLFFSAIFDAAQLRTLWMIEDASALSSVFTASLVVKLVILILETRSKRNILLEIYRHLPPESTSNIFSRILFWWLNPFLLHGFQALLSPADLFHTDPDLLSQSLENKFQHTWNASQSRTRQSLLLASTTACKRQILVAAVPRLLQTGFTFCQPFLISRVIQFVQEKSASGKNASYGLIGATAVIYIGLGLSTAYYKHQVYRLITMARGGLISLIYDKTLRLDTSALSDAAAVTLMSTDIAGINTGLANVHEIWASPVDIGISIYLLQRRLGVASIAPVAVALLSTLGSTYVAKLTHRRQKRWVEAVQNRVGLTSSFLTDIKGLKMMGLASTMGTRLERLRGVEIEEAKKYLRVDSLMNLCANAPNLLSPPATLLIYAFARQSGHVSPFTSSTVYYALTIVSLMTSPLSLALNAVPTFAASLACFERIQDYLLLEERKDDRFLQPSNTPSQARKDVPSEGHARSHSDDFEMNPLPFGGSSRSPSDDLTIFSIRDGSFGFAKQGKTVLRDINIQSRRASFTLLLGPVGSGKSTLLRAILGEVRCSKGFVSVTSPSISYCSQDSWLQNTTLKANILNGLDFDPVLYAEVTSACGLAVDVAQMPLGDLTKLGSKGTMLSGGQIQRVALARAIYARNSLLLLDDCFSGLDPTTEKLVFSKLFGSHGLLRRLGCTVVLATHASRYARDMDWVVMLGHDGTITHQGRPEKTNKHEEGYQPVSSNQQDESFSGAPEQHDAATERPPAVENDSARQTGDFSVYKYYVNSIGLGLIAIYLLLNCAYVACTRFAQVWVGYWSDASEGHPSRRVNVVYGASYAAMSLGSISFFYITLLFMFQAMVPRSARSLHHALLQTTIRASYRFLSTTDPGVTLNRFSQDMTLVDLELPSFAIQFTFAALNCIGQAVIIATGVKYMAAFIPVIFGVVYVIQTFYLKTSRQVRFLDLEAKSPLFSYMLETYAGLESIRAFSWESRFLATNRSLLDQSQRAYYALFLIQRWLGVVLALMVGGLAIALVAFATQINGITGANAIGVALINVVNFAQTLTLLITAWTSLESALGAIARIKSFTTQVESEDGTSVSSTIRPAEWLLPRRIEFRKATMSYIPGSRPTLDEVSLVIEPGMKVGICGRSGSGKSSLVLSLLRMLPVTQGSILVDDMDISTIASEVVRAAFNVLPQAAVLFPGTVRLNIDPRSTRSDAEAISVLDKLHLWDAVVSCGGLEADIEALALSQGQKQMFALARSLLNGEGRGILILDEFTSNMDAETEALMLSILDRDFAECTVVAIAHRLETLTRFDRIAVLDRGRVVEWDTPVNLLATEGGAFKSLWDQRDM